MSRNNDDSPRAFHLVFGIPKRLTEAERARLWRSQQTPEQREKRLAAERERRRRQRQKETEQQKNARRSAEAARKRAIYQSATAEQVVARREARQAEKAVRARTTTTRAGEEYYLGPMNVTCSHCSAAFFRDEVKYGRGHINMCCNFGNVDLGNKFCDYPAELSALLTDHTPSARNLRDNIRQFNSALAMASVDVQLDILRGNGPYCFRIHGQIYHYIGPLHPADGQRRSYGQIYIMDANQAAQERLHNMANANCDGGVMRDLSALIARINPFARSYRMMAEVLEQEEACAVAQDRPAASVHMVFDTDKSLDRRHHNTSTCNEVAVVYVGEDEDMPGTRHLAIHPRSGGLQKIPDISELVDPLSYPIFFPSGELGWHPKLQKKPSDRNRTRLSQKEYYCFLLQVRPHLFNPLHLGGPLFQQYVVDAWVKTEQNRLNYIRTHRAEFRSDTYRALQDFVAGDYDGPSEKRVVLPPSVPDSPRAMMQDYQDAMAIMAKYGKPDYFVTFMCNQNWREIEENLLPGQTVSDRPDIVARVFKLKMDALLKDILTGVPLGTVRAYVSIYEWQKCGLPCTHSWFIMEDADKPRTATVVNRRIRAELPDRATEPDLYEIVSFAMMHWRCGAHNPNSCKHNNQCSKKFPKEYRDQTSVKVNGYAQYRRRNDGKYIEHNGNRLDNRFVVPYNDRLLLLINAHVNVEVCTLIGAVKYLYKYMYKGLDPATLYLQHPSNTQNSDGQVIDEINAYLDARYVCAPESMHHLFGFSVEKKSNTVYRLAVHLPDNPYQAGGERQIAERATARRTTLTAWFHCNEECQRVVESGQIPQGFLDSRQYFYIDMPKFFTFHQKEEGMWCVRQRGSREIGRMYTVSPCDAERYALRLLLLRVRGALSFEHLRTVTDDQGNSCTYDTFLEAAKAHGIFDDDTYHVETLQEAAQVGEPAQMRGVFIAALAFMEVFDPAALWNAVKRDLAEDFRDQGMSDEDAEAMAYYDIEDRLHRNNLLIGDFNIPAPAIDRCPVNTVQYEPDEPAVCRAEGERLYDTLNSQQKDACDTILAALNDISLRRLFFLDGPGGSGKTYCYTTLYNIFVGRGLKVVCTAWTGIASNLLPNGRISASLFKLDIKNNYKISLHKRNHKEATLLGEMDIIIWDEASMVPKKAFETADVVLRDITQIDRPFGGKIIILGGDFRQVLPTVHRGSRAEQVDACITRSALWGEFLTLHLITNMRVTSRDTEWTSFLLTIGNGGANDTDSRVQLPAGVMGQGDIVKEVFGETVDPCTDLCDVAILAPKNVDVDVINTQVYERMSGQERVYLSNDEAVVEDSNDALYYTTEFLNSIKAPGLPPHYLCLKEGSIVMLLRNLDVSAGLCNGTRYEIVRMSRRILQCRFVCGERRGQMVLIPRIFSYEDQNLPFKLKRSQFPVRLAFAMSIDKAQGQSFSRIGLLLGGDVVSHGQLYAALSRVRSRQGLTVQGQSSRPLNIVYNEVFYDLRWHTRTKEKRDLGDIDHPEDETLPKLIKLSSDQNSDFHHEKITSRQSSFANADEVNLPFLEVKVEPTEITEMAYSTADFQDSSISKASNRGEFKNRFASVASADDVSHPRLLEVILEPNEITEMTEIHNGQSADPLALENLF